MTDTEARQRVNEWNAQYDDEHVCTDPHVWRSELTITYYGEEKRFSGDGTTKGEARQAARQSCVAWL